MIEWQNLEFDSNYSRCIERYWRLQDKWSGSLTWLLSNLSCRKNWTASQDHISPVSMQLTFNYSLDLYFLRPGLHYLMLNTYKIRFLVFTQIKKNSSVWNCMKIVWKSQKSLMILMMKHDVRQDFRWILIYSLRNCMK